MVAPLIEGAEDMEIVGMSAMTVTATSTGERLDVLLVGSECGDDQILAELRNRPALRVLRIEGNGHDLTIHELRPQSRIHHDSHPGLLLDLIRNAAREGASP